MIPRILTIIAIIIASGCCSYDKKDFDFNRQDLRPIMSFKEGDTIYYEDSKRDLDTILIYKIGSVQNRDCGGLMARSPENYLFIEIKHLPNDKMWTGKTTDISTDKIEINYQNIITIDKLPQSKEMYYSITFKDFCTSAGGNISVGKFRTDTVEINGRSITNFYEVNHGYPERVTESENIELIYWTDNDGLIAYKNKRGDWWTKETLENRYKRLQMLSCTGDVAIDEINKDIDQIVFGIYCGECSDNCATMYRYNRIGNENSFSVDNTDSYFKNRGEIIFNTFLNDKVYFSIGQEIISKIPEYLLNSEKLSERFGCPDCTDGCGIYFEITRNNRKFKFHIDYQTSEIKKPEVRAFAEFLIIKINQIGKNKKHN